MEFKKGITLAALLVMLSSFNVKAQDKIKVGGDISTTIASSYMTSDGAIGAEGLNIQPMLNLNLSGLPLVDKLNFFSWSDFDVDSNKYLEQNLGVSIPFSIGKRLLGSASYMYWNFPSGDLGDRKNVIKGSLSYDTGYGNLSTSFMHMFNDPGSTFSISYISPTLEKKLFKDLNLKVNGSVDVVYIDKFYQKTSGLGRISTAISASVSGKSWSAYATARYQKGFGKRKDRFHLSGGIKKRF